MTTVFNKIHRLKRQPEWTWSRFLIEIEQRFPEGVDEKTLYSHHRHPHKKPNAHLTKIINQLHDEFFPDPFPDDLNGLMRLYNNLVQCKKHVTQERDIDDLRAYLEAQLERERSTELLRIARLNWLLGNIHFDRIPGHRDNGRPQQLQIEKMRAIDYYQQTVEAIESYNRQQPDLPVGTAYLYKARHNILACYLNAAPSSQRSQDAEVLAYLSDSHYIENSKQALVDEPFQWRIARNGLRFSALIKNGTDVDYFFRALVNVSQRFIDLNYKPLDYAPIASSKDFRWAIDEVLTPEYLCCFGDGERKKG